MVVAVAVVRGGGPWRWSVVVVSWWWFRGGGPVVVVSWWWWSRGGGLMVVVSWWGPVMVVPWRRFHNEYGFRFIMAYVFVAPKNYSIFSLNIAGCVLICPLCAAVVARFEAVNLDFDPISFENLGGFEQVVRAFLTHLYDRIDERCRHGAGSSLSGSFDFRFIEETL